MAKLDVRIRVALLVLLVVGVWAFLALSHYRGHEAVWEWQAVQLAGYAALLYWDEHGEAPASVDELFDAGLLSAAGDGYVQLAGLGRRARVEYVCRVSFSFPDEVGAYELQGGFVRSQSTGDKLVCIEFDGDPADGRDWAYLWFRVANGGSTGDHILDELIRKRRGISSRPATAPTSE